MTDGFDDALVTYEQIAWLEVDFAVRYGGEYAGCVRKADHASDFICAVDVARDGKRVLEAISRTASLAAGARAVAYQWWLRHRVPKSQA